MINRIFFSLKLMVLAIIQLACMNDHIEEITVDEFVKEMKINKNILIIDVRTNSELTGPLGKIESAIHIQIDVFPEKINEIEKYKNKEIFVICRSGVRSAKATKLLVEKGYNARNVLGGMIEYRNKSN